MAMVTRRNDDESQQLLRTVEMFEAITRSQPDDYQSLEILREAYEKLGRKDDCRATALKLADAFAHSGQVSRAIQEFEELQQRDPADVVVRSKLIELQEQARQASQTESTGASPAQDSKPTPSTAAATTAADGAPPSSPPHGIAGDEAFARVLMAEKILTQQAAGPLLDKIKSRRPSSIEEGNTLTLFQLMVEEQLAQHDDLLVLMVTKAAKPFLPLSCYDVDRDAVFQLPRELCFDRCIVPFDQIGRSVLIATANPFDHKTLAHVKQVLRESVFWYIATPADILAALRKAHGVETRKSASTPAS